MICGEGVFKRIANDVKKALHSVDIITWGGRIPMTATFYKRFSNVAVVHFTDEMLTGTGTTIDGFDRASLLADLSQLNTGQVA